MPITIKAEFESAVTQTNIDIFTKSYTENGKSIIEFDTRKRNFKKKLGTKSNISWDSGTYTVDIKELSTLYCPIIYRFIMAKGSYYNSNGERIFFTPELDEVSTSQHVSKSLVRLSCYLAVSCGVTLRNIAALFTAIFLVEITKSSIKRWIDEIGENLPTDEEMLKKLVAIKKPTECHIDGYYPMGTDNCIMVIKDEHDRILITNEVQSENKDDAINFLQKLKSKEINIVSAFSDYSKSYTESIKEVFPDAKFQADHFHTIKNIWKNLKKAYLDFRREIKKDANTGNTKENDHLEELAKKLWDLRWTFLKKPENVSAEEIEELKKVQKLDPKNFIRPFRSIISNIVSIFDKSKDEKSAKSKLERLKKKINEIDNKHYNKIIKFLDDHWAEAIQYLTNNGSSKRASNSESGMRLLRRLEKNHDGIRSEKSRKNYIKIYQQISYFSKSDIADFINNKAPYG
jgi:polyhydroxyalkanoate synthesis regulator phasin